MRTCILLIVVMPGVYAIAMPMVLSDDDGYVQIPDISDTRVQGLGKWALPSTSPKFFGYQQTKVVTCTAAAYMLLSMMAMVIIESRKRKRATRREGITYGPIDERDRMRLEYLNNKIWKDDIVCVNMLRLNKAKFFRFCNLFRDRGLLEDTIHCSVEQQVAMFLNTVGHNLRNRLVGTNFDRSGETVSRYFNKVLRAVGELRGELIRPPSLETPTKILGNHRWDPYFKDCIGAIDGTHVRASVPKDMELSFRGRKSYASQNVMAAVDFDLRFTYVLAGWEGTAHDALVLRDALERENGLRVPQGKFYLVDAGYGAKPGFLPPFRDVRYHLNEWGNNPVQNEKELFNLRHSSLRIIVERAFGCLKRRFKILDDATPFFPFPTQVDIVVACCIIHNWVIQDGIDEFFMEENNLPSYNHATTYSGQASEHTEMVNFRKSIADQMWADRQNNNIN
ncbi:putative nuclease HARBI1 [Setaria italica]|uniref:putative nuclease HARBI1 n=1 Tax=Setaria italica TaxID=4555 RepID=UPI000BE5AB72|nr:putative nuclease HARBI1 [Setaria italica]